ncbi:hypothetical protein L3Q72_22275 [Vibrio sp. JC009]|uniref:hypothetical protein n=1 Tax=Vibrio sp. JC009 TaxID=2912314 RepID=UPI0023B1BCAA|nr:hypothetical protein [Vibrio sp. JC009]WED23961.1 hypothetical protein L3Q72_22275 [Vibrio sp. JC009]
MIVTNISDESVTKEAREHWLKYWKHFSKQEYCYCSEANCTKKHDHGVLVKHRGHSLDTLFVVPLCEEHSSGYQTQLEIDESVQVVPAELCL